jgi:hypothetical protein
MSSLAEPIQRTRGRSGPRPAPVQHERAAREVTLRNGARAEAEQSADTEALRVFSERGELLFEYDAKSGKTRVCIPEGDLEIATQRGGIDFVAQKRIRLASRERIELASEALDVDAEKGNLRIREAKFSGERFSGWVENVKLAVKRSESVAETVIEKAKNVYRSVDELAQLEAGRVRTFVAGLYQLRSRTASLKAKKAFKVDGEKIHLG